MTRTSRMDQLRIARYLDDEMATAERGAFEARFATEPELQAAVHQAQGQSRAVRQAMPESVRAPEAFAASVLAKVRQMPSRAELKRITSAETAAAEAVAAAVVYGQRLLVAALVILALSAVLGFQLLRNDAGAKLSASGDTKLMQELDAKVKQLRLERLQRERGK